MSVSAPPLMTMVVFSQGASDGVLLLTVVAAVGLAAMLGARFDEFAPWDAIGLLVAVLALFAPSLADDVTIAIPSPGGFFATATVCAGLAFAIGAAMMRLVRGGFGLSDAAGEAWRIVGMAVAATLVIREILFPPTLVAAQRGRTLPRAKRYYLPARDP
jgi:hypothetical protein